jgi:hypothetical protein
MAPVKRIALARRHDAPRPAARSAWPRRRDSADATTLQRDNQIVRGLLFGIPLGLAIWLMLALVVWWIA